MRNRIQQLGRWLLELSGDDRRRLLHFSISAIVFFVGYYMLHWSEDKLQPSLQQELVALGLLVVTAVSFCWAITLQVLYIFHKIRN